MAPPTCTVLYEDNHLLVVNKPAGIPTQGAQPGMPSVVQWGKQYIKSRYAKPGNVYLGVVSRLDAGTTGVVVLARTSKAAARLSSQFAAGTVIKTYWALVERAPDPPAGSWSDWLFHDENRRRVVSVSADQAGARPAELTYKTLRALRNAWLIEVSPKTGRKHQIRVQFSSRDLPILGDRKYGSTVRWPEGIALHARQLILTHPVHPLHPISVGDQVWTAPVPASWQRLGWDD